MRIPTGAKRLIRIVKAFACVALAMGTGCATLRATVSGYVTERSGITRSQQRLRDALSSADYVKALAWHDDDALLQVMTRGIAAYYAGQFSRSAAVLDTAALLSDDRVIASLSKDALALVTNDMARPYQPRRTERLFIPYYAMLAYARVEQWEEAAVEARRISALLAQFGGDRDEGERSMHAAMAHLAGAVFEHAGERTDAQVAYRIAHALLPALPEAAGGLSPDEGEVLVVVERGFVAHLTTEAIHLELDDEDHDELSHDDDSRRRAAGRLAARAASVPERTVPSSSSVASDYGVGTYAPGRRHHHEHDDDDYHLTIAYPSLRRSPHPWGPTLRLAVDDASVSGLTVTSVVDNATEADARRERLALATRAVARATAKYVMTKAVKDRKGETAGEIANFGASLLERADVRSWHLLPQELSIVRARVPAGRRVVRLELVDGGSVRNVEVGSVVVRQGELTIVPIRLWRDPPSAPASVVAPVSVVATADSGCAALRCP